MKMFYRQPAKSWKECIPIGNGRIGGMIFADPGAERICLNEDSLWSGYPGEKQMRNANGTKKQYLDQVRSAVAEEDYAKAEELLEKHLLGEFTESYLPLGTLHVDIPALEIWNLETCASEWKTERETDPPPADSSSCDPRGKIGVTEYERGLTLDTGIAWARMKTPAGGEIRKEYFCSYPDACMVIHIESDEPLPEVRISLESEFKKNGTKLLEQDTVMYYFQCPEHVDPNYVKNKTPIIWGERGKKFQVLVKVMETDGTVRAVENGAYNPQEKSDSLENGTGEIYVKEEICIEKPTQLTIVLTAVKELETGGSYAQLKERHVKDYQSLYSRVSLDLGEQPELPTDERLKALRNGQEDHPLFALYFQYGRYLLISSSRGKENLPATLQGIWCWEMQPPWSSNWTTNINAQMNYWPVQKCNLSECLEPYVSWMKRLAKSGEETAQKYCGCRGYSVNHNVDGWYATNPVGMPFGGGTSHEGCSEYAWFPLGGIWLCQEVWRAYEYRPQPELLKETVLPLLTGAVRFCLDWLVPFGEYYVVNPSTSPEHRFEDPKMPGRYRAVSMASTLDMSLIREVFLNYRRAVDCACEEGVYAERKCDESAKEWGHILEEAKGLLGEVDKVEQKLYPYCVGADGRLQEWYKDFREKERGHRHLSHLYGLFPGELFCENKELVDAAKKSLDCRMENGSGQTGWSCAWAAELYAVLGDGEKAFSYMRKLLEKSTYDNLWDAHPPLFFQIDGNLGGTSAIADMLVQDRGGEVKLLPALPPKWSEGSVKGLRIKGNKTVDISWKDGAVTAYQIHEG